MSKVRLTPIGRGSARTIVVTVATPEGVPVDLSGSDWTCTARRYTTASAGVPLAVDSSQLGVLTLTLSGEQSRLLDRTVVGDLEGSTFGTLLSFSAAVVPTGSSGTEHFSVVWPTAPRTTVLHDRRR